MDTVQLPEQRHRHQSAAADVQQHGDLGLLRFYDDEQRGAGVRQLPIGAVNNGPFTQAAVPETGARFRPVSPYVQDNWKVTSSLTLDLGLRYDFYPSYREVKDRFSYFDPNATNPLIGAKGALAFGGNGSGAGSCNCRTPVNDYFKGFGPRVGFAWQTNPRRSSEAAGAWSTRMATRTGGSATSRQGVGLQGYSVPPTTTFTNPVVGQLCSQYWKLDTPYPVY